MGRTSEPASSLALTFQPNRSAPVHRWYPYVEGFSAHFVGQTLEDFNLTPRARVLDPFGGCGTTAVVATMRGLDCVSIDINPFLCFVSAVKSHLKPDLSALQQAVLRLVAKFVKPALGAVPRSILSPVFANKPYFDHAVLSKIKFLKHHIASVEPREVRDFLTLGLASILVKVSQLKRAPDLKYTARAPNSDPFHEFVRVMSAILEDLMSIDIKRQGAARIINDNAIRPKRFNRRYDSTFDIVITSPPYLNGTNYYRNTKLELWILDYLSSEDDLSEYRRNAVTASINTTRMATGLHSPFPFVQRAVNRLARNAYDRRIPVMVVGYFNDMADCLKTIHRALKPGRPLVLVVGDSFFGDTHIPTDRFLARVAETVGFEYGSGRTVRTRRSRGGFKLRETVLTLRKS